MVVVRQCHAVSALHIYGGIAAILLQDLDIADGVALAVDGVTQAGALWEIAVEQGDERRAACQHLLQLLSAHHDAPQGIVVRQHADDVAVGDVASLDVVADAATVLEAAFVSSPRTTHWSFSSLTTSL